MKTFLLIVICLAIGYYASKLLSRRVKRISYGYEADIYRWMFQNGIKADTEAVSELFGILYVYTLKEQKNHGSTTVDAQK